MVSQKVESRDRRRRGFEARRCSIHQPRHQFREDEGFWCCKSAGWRSAKSQCTISRRLTKKLLCFPIGTNSTRRKYTSKGRKTHDMATQEIPEWHCYRCVCCSFRPIECRPLTNPRLEQAMQQPSELSQQEIVDNLDPTEWARLDKVRNIGIAVRRTWLKRHREGRAQDLHQTGAH